MAHFLTPDAGRQLEGVVARARRRWLLERLADRLPLALWSATAVLLLVAGARLAGTGGMPVSALLTLPALLLLAALSTALWPLPGRTAAARLADHRLQAGSALESAYSILRTAPSRLPAGADVLANRVAAALPWWRRQDPPPLGPLPGHAFVALGLALAALLVVLTPAPGSSGLPAVSTYPTKQSPAEASPRPEDAPGSQAGTRPTDDEGTVGPHARQGPRADGQAATATGQGTASEPLAWAPGSDASRPGQGVGGNDAGAALPARQRDEQRWPMPAAEAVPDTTSPPVAAGGRAATVPGPGIVATARGDHPPPTVAPSTDYEPLLPPPMNAYVSRYFQRLRDEPDGR